MSEIDLAALRAHNAELLPTLKTLRRDLHRRPELGRQLPQTQARVLAELDGLGLEISTGTALTSVVAVLRGDRPGPGVLLRGDMDALPVTERPHSERSGTEPSETDFVSEIPGLMHACGHDLHTAGLVGAARLLTAQRHTIAGAVVLMFQPGEEGPGGARAMIEEGVLEAAGDRVVAAYGLHVMSSVLPNGMIACRPGTMLAGSDSMVVTVHGRGGHGSMPHLAADPVTVAAELVIALQTAVTRQFDIFDPVVISVGKISAGTVVNVIPETATIEATIRTFSESARDRVPDVLRRLCNHIAVAHGLTASVDYTAGYPITSNDPAEVARLARLVPALFGPQSYYPADRPIPGSEDFSYVLREVPGAYFGLGAVPKDQDPRRAPYNHAPEARFDDDVLAIGPAALAALALDRLAAG